MSAGVRLERVLKGALGRGLGVDSTSASDPVRRRLRRLSRGERREEAVLFLRQFARETGMGAAALAAREAAVRASLRATGHYDHTPDELAFGARVAWRNHQRCIGRLFWRSLEVADCRDAAGPDAVAGRMFAHMADAMADGRVRSVISVFAPAEPGRTPVVIESPQVVAYAGYALPGGGVLGDPKSLELTRTAIALGWEPPATPGAFDVLPLIVRGADGRRHAYEMPAAARREVAIAHPERPGLAALGLRWYAVPCVADMVLTIGGIDYPCAPFNGHYMATEIASRDFADARRYDLLPAAADAMGIDAARDPLWRDRALTELNHAVLHSFRAAGVSIVDHHEASAQFMEFHRLEQGAGRAPSADWAWIVPPQAGAGCPVFHLPMEDRRLVPNFYASRVTDGAGLEPEPERDRGRWRARLDRARRRWRRWRRERGT